MKKVLLCIVVFCLTLTLTACGGGSKKPWRELGVSEREYNKIYNKIKYGE